MPSRRKLVAYVAPMLVFAVLLSLSALLKKVDHRFWLASAEYWIYPLQTIVCGGLLIWFRREYDFEQLRNIAFTISVAALVFVLWISPRQFLGFPARNAGFNPDLFANQPLLYWPTVGFRFLRLVIVVPLVEEIFWRGFLLRFLIGENFTCVRFGTFSWVSFVVVTLGFGFSHSADDWIAACLTGAIYNGVAYRTKSLWSCVLAHAVTNLLLGIWIMTTKQWGFW
jgi:CAAX prenyl protease-like protein